MTRSTTCGLAVAALALGACAEDALDTASQAVVVGNGQGLNGQGLNGQGLNGQGLNGQGLNGQGLNGTSLGNAVQWVQLSSLRLDGAAVEAAWLDGSELVAAPFLADEPVSGDDLAGAVLRGRSDTGVGITLRIVDVQPPHDGGDVWRYGVEYRYGQGWAPLCADDDGPVGAIAVAGYWSYEQGVPTGGDKLDDPDRFTFACPQSGAIGKCVELGYRPWASVDGVSLDGHHQACVRLMRADYCGDGTPHTVDGAVVNLYDDLGVQVDTEAWRVEAEWEAGGARCLTTGARRISEVTCARALLDDACGDPAGFDAGTLLVSELPGPTAP